MIKDQDKDKDLSEMIQDQGLDVNDKDKDLYVRRTVYSNGNKSTVTQIQVPI